MLELRLVQGSLLKKVVEPIMEIVDVANFDCSSTGITLQAVDFSQGALAALLLRPESFEHYCCDRNISIGMNLESMVKMLKCGGNDDILTIKVDDGGDTVNFMFESPTQYKISKFEMERMYIDEDNFEIPEVKYHAIVKMSSSKFARICRELSIDDDDTVVISVAKESVEFSIEGGGDIGSANIVCCQNTSVDKPEEATVIDMNESISLKFALVYMKSFIKATPLSNTVSISLSNDHIFLEYKISEIGYARFYLPPKTEEEE